MKKILLILLCLPMIGFGQLTYVPDANFEQALINLGYDTGSPNGSVPTANINTIDTLYVYGQNITNLTGIEDFTALTDLGCNYNQLSSLDVSSNTALDILNCGRNQLATLVVNNNLRLLYCNDNLLTTLDVSQCLYLEQLRAPNNKLISLDLSPNINLGDELYLSNNELTSLNIKNGRNHMIVSNQFSTFDNPYLTCIEVDDPNYSNANWTVANGNIDAQHYFALSCVSSVDEFENTEKELLKITNLLGRETKQTNQPLFYIYDDGTVEKRIIVE